MKHIYFLLRKTAVLIRLQSLEENMNENAKAFVSLIVNFQFYLYSPKQDHKRIALIGLNAGKQKVGHEI